MLVMIMTWDLQSKLQNTGDDNDRGLHSQWQDASDEYDDRGSAI